MKTYHTIKLMTLYREMGETHQATLTVDVPEPRGLTERFVVEGPQSQTPHEAICEVLKRAHEAMLPRLTKAERIEQERKLFEEAWAEHVSGRPFERDHFGDYISVPTRSAWWGWLKANGFQE